MHKVGTYLDELTHRLVKAAASRAGVSLSTFMAGAAMAALHRPDRRQAGAALDGLRRELAGRVAAEEVLAWRTVGRE